MSGFTPPAVPKVKAPKVPVSRTMEAVLDTKTVSPLLIHGDYNPSEGGINTAYEDPNNVFIALRALNLTDFADFKQMHGVNPDHWANRLLTARDMYQQWVTMVVQSDILREQILQQKMAELGRPLNREEREEFVLETSPPKPEWLILEEDEDTGDEVSIIKTAYGSLRITDFNDHAIILMTWIFARCGRIVGLSGTSFKYDANFTIFDVQDYVTHRLLELVIPGDDPDDPQQDQPLFAYVLERTHIHVPVAMASRLMREGELQEDELKNSPTESVEPSSRSERTRAKERLNKKENPQTTGG